MKILEKKIEGEKLIFRGKLRESGKFPTLGIFFGEIFFDYIFIVLNITYRKKKKSKNSIFKNLPLRWNFDFGRQFSPIFPTLDNFPMGNFFMSFFYPSQGLYRGTFYFLKNRILRATRMKECRKMNFFNFSHRFSIVKIFFKI